MKLDPIDIFVATGSSLIGRLFQFFSAGWLGLLLGRIATAFKDPGDFIDPAHAFSEVFAGSEFWMEFPFSLLWPLVVVVAGFTIWFGAGIAAILFVGAAFFVFIVDDGPTPIWWLVCVALTSLLPLWEDGSAWSWGVLAFFWIGLGAAGWWAMRAYHPNVIESVDSLMHGRKPPEPIVTPPRKAPEDAWGEHAKRDWQSDSEEDQDAPDDIDL